MHYKPGDMVGLQNAKYTVAQLMHDVLYYLEHLVAHRQ